MTVEIAMYADDTALYISNRNYEFSVQAMQEDDSLSKWCTQNNIMANTDKTKTMTFGSVTILENLPSADIKFGEVAIHSVTSYTYLGSTLEGQLNFYLHINKIVGSVPAQLKQFRHMRNFTNEKAAVTVCKGTILPILECGDISLSAASVENRRRLQVLENKGLRCALNSGLELHTKGNLLKLK